MSPEALEAYINTILSPSQFRDYAPNGCQVWGSRPIRRVACAVTASLAAIDAAYALDADALLVHHGYFWSKEPRMMTAHRYQRIARLITGGMSLFAYHLPLDAHPVLGNNAQLAARLAWQEEGRFAEQSLACYGRCIPQSVEMLCAQLTMVLGRTPLCCSPTPSRVMSRLAWCTGAAQSFFEEAIALGVDAFVTGEASEAQYHLAQETGVAFIAAGHHATERYGVQALGQHLHEELGLACPYIDIPNPV